MTRSARPHSRQAALREWAGLVLSGAREPGDPPVADSECVRCFLQAHGIGPLIAAARLKGPGGARPEDDAAVKNAVAAEMARRRELVSVLGAWPAEALPETIFFKGQALAYNAYPQPWLRPRSDVDLLVERRCVQPVVDALSGLGYERVGAIDAELVLPQIALRRSRHGVTHVWDVHWRISNRPALADILTYAELRRDAAPTRIGDVAVLTPNRVDSLLIACLHLVGHHPGEFRLVWLYDIHLLAGSLSGAEYRELRSKACRSAHARAACHAALSLTQHYLPGGTTGELCRDLDPGVGARWGTKRIYLGDLIRDAGALGRGERLRFILQHLLPSPDYMMNRFSIRHRWQLPFWYGLRIARAVPKLFRRR